MYFSLRARAGNYIVTLDNNIGSSSVLLRVARGARHDGNSTADMTRDE